LKQVDICEKNEKKTRSKLFMVVSTPLAHEIDTPTKNLIAI
jgi:hypothetical protein